MKIIGKLLKKTNEINYKRSLKKHKDAGVQNEVLFSILKKARKTKIGSTYKFDSIESAESFAKSIPIQDYQQFHDTWLEEVLAGKRDIIWPGRVRHFALSSGTTGSPSKRIPITFSMIRSFQKAGVKQFSTLHELGLGESFYATQFLAVGGSTKLTKTENYLEGDLSGILKKYSTFVTGNIAKPGRKITREADWNEKLKMMVEKAPEWNIGIIAGVPSWCILLMERIIQHYKVKSIHDIWPNLEVYVHGGVFMKPYEERLKKVLGKQIHLLDTYLASEGYFGYQKSVNDEGMQLLLNSGIYFEFVPFNSDYFSSDGELLDHYSAFSIDEVQPGIDYALVITTNAGLYRYLVGDLVRFTNIETAEVKITGRIKQYLSICGEHLSLDNINQAVTTVAATENIAISEFTIVSESEQIRHHWYIGVDRKVDGERIMAMIDKQICELNDDYRSSRKINLKQPKITLLPNEKFYEFMESIGKSGSQNKFPRVLNESQAKKWKEFLSC